MNLTTQVKGHGPIPGKALVQYAISVSFDGPIETATFTVVVPNQGSEASIEAQAIARARGLARLFAEQASG